MTTSLQSPSRWNAVTVPLAVWAVSRLALLATSMGALTINHVLEREQGSLLLHAIPALDGLCRWDCGFFDQIAAVGYERRELTNFFPLLPMLMRVLSWFGVPLHLGLIVVPNLAALLGYLGIYRVYLKVTGNDMRQATSALLLMVSFPFAFFHAAGYPETLMFAAVAWSYAFAMEDRVLEAGFVLGVGALSRHLAFLAWPGLALLMLASARRDRRYVRALFAMALPPLVFSGWMAWQAWHFGDPLSFLHARNAWAEDAWWGGLSAFTNPKSSIQQRYYVYFAAIPTLASLGLLKKGRLALAVYALCYLGVCWDIGLASLGRYAASFWPGFLPLGYLVTRYRWLEVPTLVFFATAQGVFLTLFTHAAPIL